MDALLWREALMYWRSIKLSKINGNGLHCAKWGRTASLLDHAARKSNSQVCVFTWHATREFSQWQKSGSIREQ